MFLHSYVWHNEVFAIDGNGSVWRFHYRLDEGPIVQILIGNEPEYQQPIAVLNAMKNAED